MSESLWRAVVLRMLQDIASKSQVESFNRREANAWLDSKDFYLVCEMAGLPPDKVRLAAEKIGRGDLLWRKSGGESPRYEYRRNLRMAKKVSVSRLPFHSI